MIKNYHCQFQQAANNSSGIADNHTGVSNQSGMEDRSQINSQETSATPMITQSGKCNIVKTFLWYQMYDHCHM